MIWKVHIPSRRLHASSDGRKTLCLQKITGAYRPATSADWENRDLGVCLNCKRVSSRTVPNRSKHRR